MNFQIEQWRVEQFSANVYQLSQQLSSRLAPLVRVEEFIGKAEFFDRLGLATAMDKTGRNTDTPNLDINHSRRMVTTVTREWGTLVDRKDKIQQIHMPENEYSQAAQHALGRKMDSIIIEAAMGNARTGEDGSIIQALGDGQKITSVRANAIDYANVQLLRKAKRLMDAAEVVGKRYIVHSADFLEALLAQTEVTSSDYNSVKALVGGELNTFLGFEFIHTEMIAAEQFATYDDGTYAYNPISGLYLAAGSGGIAPVNANVNLALAIVGDGVILGKNPNLLARVDERKDKGYATQVYAAMDAGGVRMEEVKVIQLIYKAS